MSSFVKRIGVLGAVLGMAMAVGLMRPHPDQQPRLIQYDPVSYPNIECYAGRVLAETNPLLTNTERNELWKEYGLELTFDWVEPESGFSYHELEVQPAKYWDHLVAFVQRRELPPRELNELIPLMAEDPRITWAAPDALVLEWCDSEERAQDVPVNANYQQFGAPRGVSFIDERGAALEGSLAAWLEDPELPDPLPDVEYYRLCAPQGTQLNWAAELSQHGEFIARCGTVYGTNQQAALDAYQKLGNPSLAPVTICIADSGVELNHPDLVNRLHPNAIDANFRSYKVAAAYDRPGRYEKISDREVPYAAGLPRLAIKGQPARHGTAVAGVLARCTEGFETTDGGVRLLPASLRSENTMAITMGKAKSPISSFVKLVRCLKWEFPVGQFEPAADAAIQNTGDVRVVSVSASVPKSYFSDMEWRLVASIAGKMAGSIAEDLRENDRLYVFAAGNEARGEPSRPGEMDYVLAVSATHAYDGSRAWQNPLTGEGSNLGEMCVSAPGYGIITSNLTDSLNLDYLADGQITWRPNFSTPPREDEWRTEMNHFAATSAATPQVAALAALLYAQDPGRTHLEVKELIIMSCGERRVTADWGEALGIVDYRAALGWD